MGLLFSFFGRIGRGGFWLGLLASIILSLGALALAYFVFGAPVTALNADGTPLQITPGNPLPADAKVIYNPISWAIIGVGDVLSFWIGLATQVKRWHDRGASGWWVLINLIPGIGGIWMLVSCGFLEGKQGENKYGPDPREA